MKPNPKTLPKTIPQPQPQSQPQSQPKSLALPQWQSLPPLQAQAQPNGPSYQHPHPTIKIQIPAAAVGTKLETRLWLVRHPKPVGVDGLCYGRLDVAVDAFDVDRVASRLATELPEGAALRSSPAGRCRSLAEAVLARRSDLRLLGSFAWLAEMDFGQWEGKSWVDIPPADLRAWTDDFADYRVGGTGESVRMFLARVGQGLEAVSARSLEAASAHSPGQAAAVEVWITHAGVMRAVHWLSEAGPCQMPSAAQWPAMSLGYGEVWAIGLFDDESSQPA